MSELYSSIIVFFIFAFAINGLLAISILILKNKPFKVANILLAVNLAGFALAPIMISLVESHLIVKIPHLLRIPSPLYYASFPAGYLYIRLIILDENKLRWFDFLHFIPAILHLIEMMPFYLLDTETKLIHINLILNNKIELYAHNEGWLPPYIHNILRGVSALTYAIFMRRLLVRLRKKELNYPLASSMMKWLKLFTLDNAVMGILLIVLLLLTSIPNDIRSIALNTCLCLGLVAANFFLFFKPEILYGLPQPLSSNMEVANTDDLHHADTENTKDINKVESDAIPGFIYEYKAKVDSFLKKSKRYLDSEFNIQDLSREMGLPKHHLQLYIYKVENKGFIEFINDYKISHLKSMIDKGELSKKTLVALASECGFSSKATFFRTIKKKTGKTPLEYFNSSN